MVTLVALETVSTTGSTKALACSMLQPENKA